MATKKTLVSILSVAICATTLVVPAAFADTTNAAPSTDTATTVVQNTAACMAPLEDQREVSLQAGFDSYSSSRMINVDARNKALESAFIAKLDAESSSLQNYMTATKNAYITRQAALKTAWAMTDKKARNNAIKAAWSAFRLASNQAHQILNNARKTAVDKWQNDSKIAEKALRDSNGITEQQWISSNRAAWTTFNDGAKTCKGDARAAEPKTQE